MFHAAGEVALVCGIVEEVGEHGFEEREGIGVGAVFVFVEVRLARAAETLQREIICEKVALRFHVVVAEPMVVRECVAVAEADSQRAAGLYPVAQLVLPDVRHLVHEPHLHPEVLCREVVAEAGFWEIHVAVGCDRRSAMLQAEREIAVVVDRDFRIIDGVAEDEAGNCDFTVGQRSGGFFARERVGTGGADCGWQLHRLALFFKLMIWFEQNGIRIMSCSRPMLHHNNRPAACAIESTGADRTLKGQSSKVIPVSRLRTYNGYSRAQSGRRRIGETAAKRLDQVARLCIFDLKKFTFYERAHCTESTVHTRPLD
jgi:hypothetical protein